MDRPPRFTFYYEVQQSDYYTLSCGRLCLDILDRWRRQQEDNVVEDDENGDDAVILDVGNGDVGDDDDDEDAVIANLDNFELWGAVARLQWAMVSDQIITARALALRLSDLTEGERNHIRLSIRQLIAALTAVYPVLARAGRPTLVQLIALGRDMATSIGESPDLFEYVKKELQAVNLAAALRV
jgi:hypothetical protein